MAAPAQSRIPFFRRLQVRLIVGFLALAYVPMGGMGVYAYLRAKHGYEDQVEQNVAGLAHLVRSRVFDTIGSADQELGIWSTQDDVKRAPQVYGQDFPVFALLQNRLRKFLRGQQQLLPVFASILCVRPAKGGDGDAPQAGGALVMFANDLAKEKREVFPDFWVQSPGGLSINSAYRWGSGERSTPPRPSPLDPARLVLPIAREYQDVDGKLTALVGLLDWNQIERLVDETVVGGARLSDLTQRGDTWTLVTDGSGNVIAGSAPTGRMAAGDVREILAAISIERTEALRMELPHTGAVFVGASAQGDGGWTVLAFKDAARAMAPIHQLRNANLGAGLLLLGVILGFGLEITRRITAPVDRLVEATQIAAGGNLQQAIEIHSRDEIGELALSFNIMIQKLRDSFGQLAEQNRELKELDRLKSEFLANTSHELRTPINGVMGLLGSILDGAYGPVDERQRRSLDMALKSAERLAGLVNGILDFSAAQRGNETLKREPVDLRKLVQDELLPLFEGLVRGKDVRIELELSPGILVVQGDKEKLRQLFVNLVGNAVKFTHHGRVAISCAPAAGSEGGGWLLCRVSDTGIGIPDTELENIFEPFRQVKGSADREYEGTGLGLAIVKQIVERHGGRISVESKLGAGSTFAVELPVSGAAVEAASTERVAGSGVVLAGAGPETAEPGKTVPPILESPATSIPSLPAPVGATSAGSPEAAHPSAPGALDAGSEASEKAVLKPGRGELVLVVDDQPVNIEVLRGRLEMHGYRVVGAGSGIEALEYLKTAYPLPDIMLLDIMMPGMSGYYLCTRLKMDEEWRDIPVIMVSAKNQLQDKVYAYNVGALDYVVKPFQKEELLSKLRTFLDLRALHRDLRSLNRTLELKVKERTQNLADANAQLRESLDRLKQAHKRLVHAEKMAGLGNMAAGIAHELNNALNIVAGNLSPLRTRVQEVGRLLHELRGAEGAPAIQKAAQEIVGPDESLDDVATDIGEIVRAIHEGAERSQGIIRNLLSFSAVGRAEDVAEHREVNLGTVLDSAVALLELDVSGGRPKNPIVITREYARDLPMVRCDASKMAQVFVNLLSNAVIACETADRKGEIAVRASSRGERLLVSVTDNGCGIPAEQLSRIFEPFVTGWDVGRGSGLGLSVAYAFVAEHMGELRVESAVGKGSTFTVDLPLRGTEERVREVSLWPVVDAGAASGGARLAEGDGGGREGGKN